MKQRKLLTMLAIVGSLALIASACSNDTDGGEGSDTASATGAIDCNTDEFGCVTVASGEPIKLGWRWTTSTGTSTASRVRSQDTTSTW